VVIRISNSSGDLNDKIANAARVIGKSRDRLDVFMIIYKGKRRIKTVTDIFTSGKLKTKKRVLEEAKKLASNDIIIQTRQNGETAYEKIDFYTSNRNTIISMVENPEKLRKLATRTNPQIIPPTITVKFPIKSVNVDFVTIDKVDNFSKVKDIKTGSFISSSLYESEIKEGLKKIIGEEGKFVDWGGEKGDLFSTRLFIKNIRLNVQFGLKGRGTKGRLVPGKMGKNGDQIQRLFDSPADVFFVQYHGQIDESVISQMKYIAIAKSVSENRKIYYGIIDGNDTAKLIAAYSQAFEPSHL
jgi:hypothetical protein